MPYGPILHLLIRERDREAEEYANKNIGKGEITWHAKMIIVAIAERMKRMVK